MCVIKTVLIAKEETCTDFLTFHICILGMTYDFLKKFIHLEAC